MNANHDIDKRKEQTIISFSDKWNNNKDVCIKDLLDENSETHKWILERNGWKNKENLIKYLSSKKRVLDAGCGNGRVTVLLSTYGNPQTEIIGIDIVSAEIAAKNLENFPNTKIYKKDLLEDLSGLGTFDYIYCQEVLHHTADPFQSFLNLCKILKNKGEIGIYVYKKKAPVREFTDEYLREKLSQMSYEEATKICEQITLLGESLSKLNIKVNIPDIPILEIPQGEYDIQRFFYHFFMKCFYNSDMSFKDCVTTNYDWYHPQLCSKYTKEEIENWFNKAGLEITHSYVDFYGITMCGRKN